MQEKSFSWLPFPGIHNIFLFSLLVNKHVIHYYISRLGVKIARRKKIKIAEQKKKYIMVQV